MIELLKMCALHITIVMLKFADYTFDLFSIFLGIKPVTIDGLKGQNLLLGLMKNSHVKKMLLGLSTAAIVMGFGFAMYSIVKNVRKIEKTPGKIAVQYLGSILSIFLVFTFMYLFILFSGEIIKLLSLKGNGQNGLSLGNRLIKEMGSTSVDNITCFDILFLEDGQGKVGIYRSDFFDKFFGDLKKGTKFFSYSVSNGAININKFPFFTISLASALLVYCVGRAAIKLTLRMYNVVFLLLVMPFSLVATPSDDGYKFGKWRKNFISEIFLAYGAIIGVNVYTTMVLFTESIKIEDLSMGHGTFLFALFKLFCVTGGVFIIPKGEAIFMKIMGNEQGEDMKKKKDKNGKAFGIGAILGAATKESSEKNSNKDKRGYVRNNQKEKYSDKNQRANTKQNSYNKESNNHSIASRGTQRTQTRNQGEQKGEGKFNSERTREIKESGNNIKTTSPVFIGAEAYIATGGHE